MTDLQLLYVVLVALYLWECACWARRGSVAFRTWLGRKWRPADPGTTLGNQRGGFVFAPPLPPLGNILLGAQLPFSLSPQALFAYVASWVNPGGRPPQTNRLFLFDEIKTVTGLGRKLVINGELFLIAGSTANAVRLSKVVNDMRQLPAAKRAAAVERLIADSLDIKAIKKRWQELETSTAHLRPLTNWLFLYLFGLAPLVIWRFGLSANWPALLVVLLVTTASIMFFFRRAHRRLYPLAEDERFSQTLMVLLYPALAIRARDLLSRPLFEPFHPLALARVFCPERVFLQFAARVVRELKYPAMPVCPTAEPAAQDAERHSRELLLQAVEKFTAKNGASFDELLKAPLPADESCRSYCPRCLAQFTAESGTCLDCGGLRVLALPKTLAC